MFFWDATVLRYCQTAFSNCGISHFTVFIYDISTEPRCHKGGGGIPYFQWSMHLLLSVSFDPIYYKVSAICLARPLKFILSGYI